MGNKIVIELTNRCNLHCQHCFSGRHGGRDDLSLDILQRVLAEARPNGFDYLSFTGGDPTVHRHFAEVLRLTSEAGYQFSLNTNGWNFTSVHPVILPYRENLSVITFSLDGATEATHDRLRGKRSFRRMMQAVTICMMEGIPFTLNMVVTAHNQHELADMVRLGTRLGSQGVRFGHLMPAPLTTQQGFDLSPKERKQVEAEIWQLRRKAAIPVAMAPGHHTTDLFPCAPLHMQEVNIDCHGYLTKCCHLSGHGDGMGQEDVIGNLAEISFTEAYQRLVAENTRFHQAKRARIGAGRFEDEDFFACWYCSNHYGKVGWLAGQEEHPWRDALWESATNGDPEPAAAGQPIELHI